MSPFLIAWVLMLAAPAEPWAVRRAYDGQLVELVFRMPLSATAFGVVPVTPPGPVGTCAAEACCTLRVGYWSCRWGLSVPWPEGNSERFQVRASSVEGHSAYVEEPRLWCVPQAGGGCPCHILAVETAPTVCEYP